MIRQLYNYFLCIKYRNMFYGQYTISSWRRRTCSKHFVNYTNLLIFIAYFPQVWFISFRKADIFCILQELTTWCNFGFLVINGGDFIFPHHAMLLLQASSWTTNCGYCFLLHPGWLDCCLELCHRPLSSSGLLADGAISGYCEIA